MSRGTSFNLINSIDKLALNRNKPKGCPSRPLHSLPFLRDDKWGHNNHITGYVGCHALIHTQSTIVTIYKVSAPAPTVHVTEEVGLYRSCVCLLARYLLNTVFVTGLLPATSPTRLGFKCHSIKTTSKWLICNVPLGHRNSLNTMMSVCCC